MGIKVGKAFKRTFKTGKKLVESPLKKVDKNLEKVAGKLGPVGKTLYQIGDATKEGLVKGVLKDPSRLLTGVDPVSTKIWNAILGTNKKSLVSVTGGPTKGTLNKIGATKLTRGVFKVADTAAMYFGTMGAASGLGNAFSSMTAAGGAPAAAAPGAAPAAGVADTSLAPVQVTAQKVGSSAAQNGFMRGLSKGGGLIKSAMSEPVVQSAAIGVGGQLAGGVMADRAAVKDRNRYNRNVGTELWPMQES